METKDILKGLRENYPENRQEEIDKCKDFEKERIEILKETDVYKLCSAFWESPQGKEAIAKAKEHKWK